MEQLMQPEPIEKRPQFPAVKRKEFGKLLDERFIDPKVEAAILPQEIGHAPIVVVQQQAAAAKKPLIQYLYEYISLIISTVKRRLSRRRQRLTRRGAEALEQLKYLADLCEATSVREAEEVMAIESAFGQAYYEIMRLSEELAKMSQEEQEHHLRRYQQQFLRFVRSLEQ
ncbi:MAG: hypothetical protein N3G80_02645 [Candidatus Micrarchaeota archaeon]|nr:hypothetical protein [Candidatus Micrarchaeota archaeon]